jgi:hypothetical protein
METKLHDENVKCQECGSEVFKVNFDGFILCNECYEKCFELKDYPGEIEHERRLVERLQKFIARD